MNKKEPRFSALLLLNVDFMTLKLELDEAVMIPFPLVNRLDPLQFSQERYESSESNANTPLAVDRLSRQVMFFR
jgi:hypothetical protein